MDHSVTLERHDETLKDLTMEGWGWVCSCGRHSRQNWFSKYAAQHAAQNHVIRSKKRKDA